MIPTSTIHRLVRFAAGGAAGLVVAVLFGVLAVHLYGSHRLDAVRADFEARWGHVAHPAPPRNVPEHENGARWLVAGGQAIICSLEDQRFYGGLADRPIRSWSEADADRAARILGEQKSALDILTRSGSFSSFQLGLNGSKAQHEETDFISISLGLRLLVLEARMAWREGRRSDCLEAINAIGRAADGLMRTPMVMTSTIGSASTRWLVWAAADIVSDPCADDATLSRLRLALPREDPVYWNDVTMAVSVAEIADEKLSYIDEIFDPSMGWSIPFWVSSHYLFEDLLMAEILDRWNRQLEAGQPPAAEWPEDALRSIWNGPAWPPWMALTGTITPNLLAVRARAQAAATEIQQLELALALRAAASSAGASTACESTDTSRATALTGEPMTCRYHNDRRAIVIGVPGASSALLGQSAANNRSAVVPPLELRFDCRSGSAYRTNTNESQGQ